MKRFFEILAIAILAVDAAAIVTTILKNDSAPLILVVILVIVIIGLFLTRNRNGG